MNVMVIDDDVHTCWLLETMLNDMGQSTQIFSSPEEALMGMVKGDYRPDCIFLDKQMPVLSGVDVLKAIQNIESLSETQVIMLSSDCDDDTIATSFFSGARLYLQKPVSRRMLQAVLGFVKIGFENATAQKEQLKTIQQGAQCVASMVLRLQRPDQVFPVAKLVSLLSSSPANTVLGIVELLTNSIEHGNLAIGYKEKSRLLEIDELDDEVQRRLNSPEFWGREVTLEATRVEQRYIVRITDQGAGFDWRPYMDFCPMRAAHAHGRGIALANHSDIQSLRFLGLGNIVEFALNAMPASQVVVPSVISRP